jgi:hypothetical protein
MTQVRASPFVRVIPAIFGSLHPPVRRPSLTGRRADDGWCPGGRSDGGQPLRTACTPRAYLLHVPGCAKPCLAAPSRAWPPRRDLAPRGSVPGRHGQDAPILMNLPRSRSCRLPWPLTGHWERTMGTPAHVQLDGRACATVTTLGTRAVWGRARADAPRLPSTTARHRRKGPSRAFELAQRPLPLAVTCPQQLRHVTRLKATGLIEATLALSHAGQRCTRAALVHALTEERGPGNRGFGGTPSPADGRAGKTQPRVGLPALSRARRFSRDRDATG